MSPLLRVADLTVSFPGSHDDAPVVQGVGLTLEAGETLALVGESGSGKSVTALSAKVMGNLALVASYTVKHNTDVHH